MKKQKYKSLSFELLTQTNAVDFISVLECHHFIIISLTLRSSIQTENSGVPQGSILGPVLFLLFVNDMPLFINEAYVDIYADDTASYCLSSNKYLVYCTDAKI